MRKFLYKYYDDAGKGIDFNTFEGFSKNPAIGIYSFEGKPICIGGRLVYSNNSFEKSYFGSWKHVKESVTDTSFSCLSDFAKDRPYIKIDTSIESRPKSPVETRTDYFGRTFNAVATRFRNVTITVEEEYSASYYKELKCKFSKHQQLLVNIIRQLGKQQNDFMFKFPYGAYYITNQAVSYSPNCVFFDSMGFMPLKGDVNKVVFADCLLDIILEKIGKQTNIDASITLSDKKLTDYKGEPTYNEVILCLGPTKQKILNDW